MTDKQLTRSREYQALVIEDFKKRVYPLAIACSIIFAVFFAINIFGTGKPIFIVSDAVATVLFAILAILVKRSVVPPYVGSIFILSIVLFFYITIIIYGGSLHGMLFFYCTIPFFAFYMAGTRIGIIYGLVMMGTLLLLWAASQFTLLKISYDAIEMMVVAILLSFTVISAWFFERTREEAFASSYQSGVRHETLMEALDEVYYRVGMDGIIQEIGEPIYALTGFSPKDVEDRPIETFYADPSTRDAYLKALKESGNVKNYPIEILGKYGQRVAISMSSRMFFDDEGKPIYIEGLIRDMTQEREIQKERTENLQHLSNLSVIESTLSEQDFEVGLQRAVEEIQKIFAAERVFLSPLCFNPNDEQDSSYKTMFIANPEQDIILNLKNLMCESEMITYASSVPEKQLKTPFMIDVKAVFSPGLIHKYHLLPGMLMLLRVKSDVLWVLAIQQDEDMTYTAQKKRLFVDISHRIRGALSQLILQKDLQATVERVEIASHAKSEFLATMSHELRTPLHGVIGLLDLLAEEKTLLSPEQQRNLVLAQTSSQVLSSLIDDVLDLAKIESGKVEIQKQSFYLRDALHDALVPFVMKAREKGLSLTLELKDVAAVIEGDVVRLRQVLLNLVGNAIKFTMQGYVRIVVTQDEDILQINIEDSGIGIDKLKQDVVFQPFTQVHDVHILGDNLQEKGTGLGTTISQHFVEMMGGTLTLQSEPNIGSTMSIRLPLQQIGEQMITENLDMSDFSKQGKTASTGSRIQAVEPESWSVLLAEDDPVGRRIALKRLQGSGFDVDEVTDGLAAWDKIQTQDYDLLLTDIRMPGLDGMSLTKKIREYEAAQGKKAMLIIGLSAYALEEVKHDALACGMDAFVSKPVDMTILMAKLEEHCGNEFPKVVHH